ncbi:MAG: dTMP kinase [Gammaproteobacteria bacterium]|nr:dTMP kinase [Gammaproteobacteria bacterium]MDH5512196.1 dTMP kinase [Gammaproteobacteria bacterium]
MPRPLFITLEGGEGAGKSTNLVFVRQWLQHEGFDVIVTREPGGTEVGERVRDILLHGKQTHITPESEMLLMFAARFEHINKVIRPALAAGKVVLCDRFTDATYAYQGGGRGLDADRIAVIENWVQGDLRPDLTLLFDVPVEAGRERAGQRSEPDRFERENNEFFRRVRETYLARAAREPDRIRLIDASRPLEQVEQQITGVLQELMHGT